MVVELTDAGRKKVLEYQAGEITIKKPRRWDGFWRVIFSDIPESHKKAREALRAKFREWGFISLQKSVFVFPFPCEDEIAIMRDLYHIPSKSILIIETRAVDNSEKLKQYFGL